jgi:phosphoribosyl 1,2-cyclic phosphodiesterase
MKVRIWGARGSLATPGPETTRYGGNTSCVEVRGRDGSLLVLDAGTGIRRLGAVVGPEVRRIDLLLTHLHLDHIEGLGFFAPLFRRDLEMHVWGPASTTLDLRARLSRFLSPPLFPVRLRDLPCQLELHDVASIERFRAGAFEVQSALVCHPGPTVGFRITEGDATLSYLSDHEPAFGGIDFPNDLEWTSGYELAAGADLLIHDAQYDDAEYAARVGWGHSSLRDALAFARATGVRRIIPFHYDPAHTDAELDGRFAAAEHDAPLPFELLPAVEGASFEL